MSTLDLEKQRRFALEVVAQLRRAGHEAYWAGGCVRDQLLGRVPKDYDVATAAAPEQVRELFGHRRTLAVGAAFGVICVLGPRDAGQVEVTTFRRDAPYSDGRHPDSVVFSSAQEDASRRDFTVNGLFYDPAEERVIDFVDGQEDIRRRVIRAIGRPEERFAEDKLRMLRAVRFAATFGFALDEATRATIAGMAAEIAVVSAERIAMEMRRMLEEAGRAGAVRMLLDTGLAQAILPEIVPSDSAAQQKLAESLAVLERLAQPGFPLALAALLGDMTDAEGAVKIGRRWRLANKEIERTEWLLAHRQSLQGARTRLWSIVQPIVVAPGIDDLLAWHEATIAVAGGDASDAAWCRSLLAQPRDVLDPPPLVSGDDLLQMKIPSGPLFRKLLDEVRSAQLDGRIHDKQEATALVEAMHRNSQP